MRIFQFVASLLIASVPIFTLSVNAEELINAGPTSYTLTPNFEYSMGVDLPLLRHYSDLTAKEKAFLKSLYNGMGQKDEPPYPADGFAHIYEKLGDARASAKMSGKASMAVAVDAAGQPLSVKVVDSPNSSVTAVLTEILMSEKYKPALCAGKSCNMSFPFFNDFATESDEQSRLAYQQGRNYFSNKNYEQAFQTFLPLAERNYLPAVAEVGWMYYEGKGTPENFADAVAWTSLAAHQGSVEAQNNLGWMYYSGKGIPIDLDTARNWFVLAAGNGNMRAPVNLANMYSRGQGVPKNEEEAVKWFRLAAIHGNTGAQAELGARYLRGKGVDKECHAARYWLNRAANQGNSGAQALLGVMYFRGNCVVQNYAESLRWNQMAIQKDNTAAENNLGWMYYTGEGQTKNYTEALKWFYKAADKGASEAWENLGQAFENGNGVAQNYAEALKWYGLGANQGNANAQNALGEMYKAGRGVTQNYEQAAKWFEQASDQNNLKAMKNLATLYREGLGVKQDLARAEELTNKAAKKEQEDKPYQESQGEEPTLPKTKIKVSCDFGKNGLPYPLEAKKNNEQGRALVNFYVGTDGYVHDAQLLQSSGSASLDSASLYSRDACVYKAIDGEQVTFPGWMEASLVWELK